MGWAQLGLTLLAVVAAIYTAAVVRGLAKAQRGTRQEVRRLRRRTERVRDEMTGTRRGFGLLYDAVELVAKMVRGHHTWAVRSQEDDFEVERVDPDEK